MAFKIRRYILICIFPGILLCAGLSDKNVPSFGTEDGTLSVHYFEEKIDSLSGPEIYEWKDSNGLTIWFGRYIFKDVCISGECKMIRLWLFWDGAGDYLGMKLPQGEPLTKSDHTEFDEMDYAKLESILRDKFSLLKELKQEELIVVPENVNSYEVDGYTAATKPGLDQVVVKDAVYTCYTLWHTVHGPVRNFILETIESRINDDYLKLLLTSEKPSMIAMGIAMVAKNPGYHPDFYPMIARTVLSGNPSLAEQALAYFIPSRLTGEAEQQMLCSVIPEINTQNKFGVIWKLLETGSVHEPVVLQLLRYFETGELPTLTLNLIYKMIQPDYIDGNHEINSILGKLSAHKNAYIRNLTAKLLANR